MFYKYNIVILIFILVFYSCSDYTPKPIGYPRIDRIESKSKIYKNKAFSFEYPDVVIIDSMSAMDNKEVWFNLVYPQYSARIYCTYLPIKKNELRMAVDDSYKLAYSHAVKAQQIEQSQYVNESHNAYGVLYDIEGNVAVPIQFFLTDSVSHFFRGSLYYDSIYNVDSILPITNYLKDDIIHIMESFEWNPQ